MPRCKKKSRRSLHCNACSYSVDVTIFSLYKALKCMTYLFQHCFNCANILYLMHCCSLCNINLCLFIYLSILIDADCSLAVFIFVKHYIETSKYFKSFSIFTFQFNHPIYVTRNYKTFWFSSFLFGSINNIVCTMTK